MLAQSSSSVPFESLRFPVLFFQILPHTALVAFGHDRISACLLEFASARHKGTRKITVAGNHGHFWGEQHRIETGTKLNYSRANSSNRRSSRHCCALTRPSARAGAMAVTVAPEGYARAGRASANLCVEPGDANVSAPRCRSGLAGAQNHGDRPAALGVVDMNRQEAVFVMRVEQHELLTTVRHVDRVVDIERHRARRAS
jgi:hypothetical protein